MGNRYRDVSQNPRLRSRLGLAALSAMILGVVLPLLFVLIFHQGPHGKQEETVTATLTSDLQQGSKKCYEAQASTDEKNILGFSSAHINYLANWCVQDGQVTELRGQKTFSITLLGWSLGEEQSTVTGNTLTIYQPVGYKFLNLTLGYSQVIEFTVSADGQAKVVKTV